MYRRRDRQKLRHAGRVRPVKLAPCSDDAQTFLISDEKVGTISIAEGQLSVLRGGRSWTSKPTVVVKVGQFSTSFFYYLVKVLGVRTVEMGSVRMSWWTTMSRMFGTLINDIVEVVFDNLGFQAYGNCRGRSSSLSEIMQIATLTVHVVVALTLSRSAPVARRRSF